MFFTKLTNFPGCPTTPVRGSQRAENGSRIAASVEEALASLTTEMVSLKILAYLNVAPRENNCSKFSSCVLFGSRTFFGKWLYRLFFAPCVNLVFLICVLVCQIAGVVLWRRRAQLMKRTREFRISSLFGYFGYGNAICYNEKLSALGQFRIYPCNHHKVLTAKETV